MNENPYASPSPQDSSGALKPLEHSVIICGFAGALLGSGAGSASAAVAWTLLALIELAFDQPAGFLEMHDVTVQLSMGFVAAGIVGTLVGIVLGGMCGVLTPFLTRQLRLKRPASKLGLSMAVFASGFAAAFLAAAWPTWPDIAPLVLLPLAGATAGAFAGRLFARKIYPLDGASQLPNSRPRIGKRGDSGATLTQ